MILPTAPPSFGAYLLYPRFIRKITNDPISLIRSLLILLDFQATLSNPIGCASCGLVVCNFDWHFISRDIKRVVRKVVSTYDWL